MYNTVMDRLDLSLLVIASFISIAFIVDYFRSHKKASKDLGSVEGELTEQRDHLENRLSVRTEENIVLKKDDLLMLENQAEFGKLSQGLFHDLMSPLTSISLHLEKMSSGNFDTNDAQNSIGKIVQVSRKMNEFMQSVRNIIGDKDSRKSKYSSKVTDSINTITDLYGYKLRLANIKIQTLCNRNIILPIHPVRLNQLFMNLISNSIDAYEMSTRETHKSGRNIIKISISESMVENGVDQASVNISILDNGKGMEDYHTKQAFKESFSTKTSGSGIGLNTVRDIVEKELHGKISIKSKINIGTEILISIPIV